MKSKILILNVLNYSTEEKEGVRLSYLLTDKNSFVDNKRYKGYTEVNNFYANKEVFELIDREIIGKDIEANFVEKRDVKNPLNIKLILESIVYNGRTIKLVQSKD